MVGTEWGLKEITMKRILISVLVIAGLILGSVFIAGEVGYAQPFEQRRNNTSDKLLPGDIFAVKAGDSVAEMIATQYMTPRTDRFHFGLIWTWGIGGDFVIIESTYMKGLELGLLSEYSGDDVEFYRVDCSWAMRQAALNSLHDWEGAEYDVQLYHQSISYALRTWLREGERRMLQAEEFPYSENDSLICTEVVDAAYDSVGIHLIPPGVLPTPSGFKQAELEGKIRKLDIHLFAK